MRCIWTLRSFNVDSAKQQINKISKAETEPWRAREVCDDQIRHQTQYAQLQHSAGVNLRRSTVQDVVSQTQNAPRTVALDKHQRHRGRAMCEKNSQQKREQLGGMELVLLQATGQR